MDDFEFLRFFFCNRSGNFFSSGRIASPISDAIRHPEGWHPLLVLQISKTSTGLRKQNFAAEEIGRMINAKGYEVSCGYHK
ncbi:MAG: hypothetical protein WC987_08400 [Mariniphaga sp.]